jgi:tetratricopeptide (TPR) repeat protein
MKFVSLNIVVRLRTRRIVACCGGAALMLLSFVGAAFGQQDSFDQVAARAAAARGANDIPGAIRLYAQGEKLNPQWSSGWWSLGLLQYSTKDWGAARDALTHYIDLSPEDAPATLQAIALRGLCEFETRDFLQSLSDLERSITLGAADDQVNERMLRYREALVLTRLGRFEESLGVYAALAKAGRVVQIDPEANVSVGLAGLRSAQLPADVTASEHELYAVAGDAALRFLEGDKEGAEQAFADFFQRFPYAANAHYLYGFLMLSTDWNGTVAEYKRELQVAPANETAAAMLAWLLLAQEKPAQALPYAQKAVDEAPGVAVAQLVLGRSLVGTGDLPKGIEHLETAMQLQPGYLETHVALASAYSSAGRQQDARRERMQSLQMAKASVAQP